MFPVADLAGWSPWLIPISLMMFAVGGAVHLRLDRRLRRMGAKWGASPCDRRLMALEGGVTWSG